jgi:shikimate dehydrogenase
MKDQKKTKAGTQLYGVIGHPVAHSLSPFIMNRAFRQFGIDAAYLRFDVAPDRLARAVEGLVALGARGANVTYPYKEEILQWVDVPSPDAELIGAVNTLVLRDGQIIGHNTDAQGAATALESFGSVSLEASSAFIFGAGGAARAAALGLLRGGAANVTFGVRSPKKQGRTVRRLRDAFPRQVVETVTANQYRLAIERADIVINATPVGSGGGEHPQLIEDPAWIRSDQCCFDFVYYPGDTAFLSAARERGARVLGGVALLVCQAVESFRQWTGRTFDAGATLEALEAAFPERSPSRLED